MKSTSKSVSFSVTLSFTTTPTSGTTARITLFASQKMNTETVRDKKMQVYDGKDSSTSGMESKLKGWFCYLARYMFISDKIEVMLAFSENSSVYASSYKVMPSS